MYLSLEWLTEYLEIPWSGLELGQKLSEAGFNLEGLNDLSSGLSSIKVGQVVSVAKHPQADRLQLVEVDLGDQKIQVVAGQVLVLAVGDLVPVAVAPAMVLAGEIKRSKIRGELSEGMICVESELRLGASDQLIKFPKKTLLGTEALPLLGLTDQILDLEVTSNRGDALSIQGLAREVAVSLKKHFQLPAGYGQISAQKISELKVDQELRVEVNSGKCQQYLAKVIKGVQLKESPVWLQRRLIDHGFKPINNIVDITNYVLLETGQPLHAFDQSLVGSKIEVRESGADEKLLALDGQEYELPTNSLVIANQTEILALAGVIGGLSTEIKANTQDIILEAAIFEADSIRGVSRQLGLRTEASSRFERQIDHQKTQLALDRAVQLILEVAGGQVLSGTVEVGQPLVRQLEIKLEVSLVNQLLGLELDIKQLVDILDLLGCLVVVDQDLKTLVVTPPSWRWDLNIREDLVEEIGRVYGYHKLPVRRPVAELNLAVDQVNPFVLAWERGQVLINQGFSEVQTSSFVNGRQLELLGVSNPSLKLANPLSSETEMMRQSLLPGLVKSAILSVSNRCLPVQIFEYGTVWSELSVKEKNDLDLSGGGGQAVNQLGFKEVWKLGLLAGHTNLEDAFKKVKGALELVFEPGELLLRQLTSETYQLNLKGLSAEVMVGQLVVLPQLSALKLKLPLVFAELQLDLLPIREEVQFKPWSTYPKIIRDLSFYLPVDFHYADLVGLCQQVIGPLLTKVSLVDDYLAKDCQRSVTIQLEYGSSERTLQSAEIVPLEREIVALVRDKGGSLRGSL